MGRVTTDAITATVDTTTAKKATRRSCLCSAASEQSMVGMDRGRDQRGGRLNILYIHSYRVRRGGGGMDERGKEGRRDTLSIPEMREKRSDCDQPERLDLGYGRQFV